MTEALSCKGEDVYIVGGANSAGQAAMHFSKYARRAVMLVRGRSLSATMSQYLIDQIKRMPNVEVVTGSHVAEVHGTERVEAISIHCTDSNETNRVPATSLYVFIGAEPRTDWLAGLLQRDDRGFILTGDALVRNGKRPQGWPLDRDPYWMETSVPGIFAAGGGGCVAGWTGGCRRLLPCTHRKPLSDGFPLGSCGAGCLAAGQVTAVAVSGGAGGGNPRGMRRGRPWPRRPGP